MTQPTTLTELRPAEFRRAIGRLVAVYAAAMNPPQRMLAGRESILERHAANPGFRALAVRATGADGPVLAGFIYGFHGVPGQWWHDMVAAALASTYPPSATPWLADSFEIAELHVLPAYQGTGIGRRLLLELTAAQPERTAVLSTQDAESRARKLYRSVGFTDLLTGFRFSGGEPPYAVMGAALPLRAPHPGSAAPGGNAPDTAASRDPAPPRSARPSSW
jgi:ribosomal protein S18 acetylase RimI-like enzyme